MTSQRKFGSKAASFERSAMRKLLSVLIIYLLAAFGFAIPATQAIAQNVRDFMNMFGGIIRSAVVQATQAEWRKLNPAEVSCVDQTLRQRGISLQALIQNGITPSDNRISEVLGSCRFQIASQEPINLPFQSNVERPSTGIDRSIYTVDKIPLGARISFESSEFREYQCRGSDQFEGSSWCTRKRTERHSRGPYESSYTILHSPDGRAYYLNRQLNPAFFNHEEINSNIDRLSRKFGQQPHLISIPRGNNSPGGVIASWGEVVLEALNANDIAVLSAGRSPRKGILLDYINDFQQSSRLGLPVYRLTGGAGFVWAASYDATGRGTLRFFAIDASALSVMPPVVPGPETLVIGPVASDAWEDCQSPDTETRLTGCTAIIDAKGSNRVRLADALDGRCSAYNQKRQYDLGLADCKSAIDLNPSYSYAYANLGASYLGLGDPSNGITALNKAVALKTNFLWSRLGRARAFEQLGSNEEALKDYQYSLLLDPTNQSAKDGLIRLMRPATAQASDVCIQPENDERTSTASLNGLEAAISAIVSTTETYKAKLSKQTARIEELSRENAAAEKRQVSAAGTTEDRKRITDQVQRFNEATNDTRSRLEAVSQKISEQESKLNATEGSGTGQARNKANEYKKLVREELAKVRSAREEIERAMQQKISEQNVAVSTSQLKATEISAALIDVETLITAKRNAEQCATEIKTGMVALSQKTDELRLRQKVEALKALQTAADSLLVDLSQFAQQNPNLIPLEIGPLVGRLKASRDDFEKCSEALGSLQKRLDEIPEFKGFRVSMEEKRKRSAQAELDDLVGTAQIISDFIESHARKNITSDFARDLLKLKGSVSEALISPESQSLREIISKSESEFHRLSVDADYKDFQAKHPRPGRRLREHTTERNRYLLDGPLDETTILVNETGQAGVIRNLRGDLIFEDGKASLCFPHENIFDDFALSEIKSQVREKGARTVDISRAPCAAGDLEQYDTVAVNRGLLSAIALETATALLNAVDKGELAMIGAVSDSGLQIKRNAESIKSLQIENNVLKQLVEGYGLVSIANGPSFVCQTVNDQSEAHDSLVTRSFDRLQVELKSAPSVRPTSVDAAFVSTKRGQCGAIYGSSKDLKQLIISLQRDKLSYHVLPMWFSEEDVKSEQTALETRLAKDAQEKQKLDQKKKDDQLLKDLRDKLTDEERKKRQDKLRKDNGALARGLERGILDEINSFLKQEDDRTHVKQEWPEFADWYQARIRDQWELENVTSDLNDYGVVEWKNRVLEAGFASITFKMKHRLLGEHQQTCFIFGHIVDREFEVERDPVMVSCDRSDKIERYKLARSFSSKWFAAPDRPAEQ
jgi:tetratricopeptide (TPR) repeat protein